MHRCSSFDELYHQGSWSWRDVQRNSSWNWIVCRSYSSFKGCQHIGPNNEYVIAMYISFFHTKFRFKFRSNSVVTMSDLICLISQIPTVWSVGCPRWLYLHLHWLFWSLVSAPQVSMELLYLWCACCTPEYTIMKRKSYHSPVQKLPSLVFPLDSQVYTVQVTKYTTNLNK